MCVCVHRIACHLVFCGFCTAVQNSVSTVKVVGRVGTRTHAHTHCIMYVQMHILPGHALYVCVCVCVCVCACVCVCVRVCVRVCVYLAKPTPLLVMFWSLRILVDTIAPNGSSIFSMCCEERTGWRKKGGEERKRACDHSLSCHLVTMLMPSPFPQWCLSKPQCHQLRNLHN